MSPLPTISLRCAPEHAALIRDIARALRTRPGLADALAALLADASPSAAPAPVLADVLARLEAVERWISERNTPVLRCSAADDEAGSAVPAPAPEGNADAMQGNTPTVAPAAPEAAPTAHPGEFSDAIKRARTALKWSTRKLAAEAGVSQTTVSHIETGRTPGTPENRAKIAAALGIEV